jgi:hypothetical protein
MRKLMRWLMPLSALVAFGCGNSDANANEKTCQTGSERCGCFGNNTCNSGLICKSGLCVNQDSSNADGLSTGNTGGTNDAGGASGTAGADSLVGASGASGTASVQVTAGDAAGISNSGGSSGTGTVGLIAGSGGFGAAGSGGSNGSGQLSCQVNCDTVGATCNGFCMTYTNGTAKISCEDRCVHNTTSCNSKCSSSGLGAAGSGGSYVSDQSNCQLSCSAVGATCNSFCTTYTDPAVKQDCEDRCIQDMTSCDAQC